MSADEILSKKAICLICVISVIVITIGITLLALGYNEAFFLNFTVIQAIFKAISYLGEAIVLIVVIAIFYIIYDKKFAKNLALSLLCSTYVNEMGKNIFQDPRPLTNIDSEAEYGYVEPDYGFPSGHTQMAVTVWGYIGYEFKEKPKKLIVPIITSILIFLIAISRVIIGVHDLQDIIGGYVIGICVLLLFVYLEPFLTPKFNSLTLSIRILIVVIVSLSLFTLGTLLFPTAGLGLLDNVPLYPDKGSFAVVGGALLGIGVGYLLENEYIHYDPSKLKKSQKIINLIIGILILLVSYYGLSMVISGNVLFRFIRYASVAFILTFFLPLLFTKINKKSVN